MIFWEFYKKIIKKMIEIDGPIVVVARGGGGGVEIGVTYRQPFLTSPPHPTQAI